MVAVPSKGRADVVSQRLAPEAVATRELYERHAGRIFAFCMSRLRNREEAEDATQSTFLNAFRGLQRGVEPEYESAWLFRIAQNVCLTRQRSIYRRRRIETSGDLDAVQDVLPSPVRDADELIGLPEALEGMPGQQRHALLLREWQGLSYREIGEELGLSQSAVETLLFRARRSLAQGLSAEPKKRSGVARRLRAGGDAGTVAALVKTLLFSGGAKVAATALAGAAIGVVAATPAARHAIVTRHVHASPPAVVAPAVATARVSHRAAVVSAPTTHAESLLPVTKPGRHLGSSHVQPVAPAAVHSGKVLSQLPTKANAGRSAGHSHVAAEKTVALGAAHAAAPHGKSAAVRAARGAGRASAKNKKS